MPKKKRKRHPRRKPKRRAKATPDIRNLQRWFDTDELLKDLVACPYITIIEGTDHADLYTYTRTWLRDDDLHDPSDHEVLEIAIPTQLFWKIYHQNPEAIRDANIYPRPNGHYHGLQVEWILYIHPSSNAFHALIED